MTALSSAHVTSSPVPAHPPKPRIWGMDAIRLHDLVWRQRGISIVRCGGHAPIDTPVLRYLLVEPTDLVLFTPDDGDGHRRARTPWIELLRIDEFESTAYSERIECDTDDQFIAVRRRYRPGITRSAFVAMTNDVATARRWSHCEDSHAAWMDLRVTRGWRESAEPVSREGKIFRSDQRREANRFFVEIMNRIRPVKGGTETVTEGRPMVRVHPKAHVSRHASLIGPVWIGAGQVIVEGDVVVGPCVLEDVIDTEIADVEFQLLSTLDDHEPSHSSPERRGHGEGLNRLLNIILSLVALGLTLPLYPLVALLIWIEDGRPIFFRHTRQKRGGEEFECLKFRTMCKDAERLKATLCQVNASDGPQFHMPDDPRLLRVGRWLRRFHLDELPQFINVLIGDMNIVGPRPSPDGENQCCPAWRETRLSVRPGITGLWQVCRTRKPNTDFQEWIRYDMQYVRHRSWRLDCWIIWKTFWKMLCSSE